MNRVANLQSYSLAISTAVVFFIWSNVPRLVPVFDFLQNPIWVAVLGGIMSFGFYKAMIAILFQIAKKFEIVKKLLLGPAYLNGTWVGFYVGTSGNVRYFIERFEQELDGLTIRGSSLNEDKKHHAEWTSTTFSIDVKMGKLSYMYDCESQLQLGNNNGLASFIFERAGANKPPYELRGWSSDLHVGKKIFGMETKISDSLITDRAFSINKAVEFYEKNKTNLDLKGVGNS